MKNKPETNLSKIAEILLAPILAHKPPSFSLKAWFEIMMHTEDRPIVKYIVKEPFKMPGLYMRTAHIKLQGLGYRRMTPEVVLWVRTDIKTPDVVEVEACIGVGEKTHWYTLDKTEWMSIRPRLIMGTWRNKGLL